MWGKKADTDAINFEWPTQEIMDQWPEDVHLKSITFSTFGVSQTVVSSVQCTLSTDEKSPLFDTKGVDQHHSKTINFDAARPVRSVQARDNSNSPYTHAVTFLDRDGSVIDIYNPNNDAREGVVHAIAEDEELIGVYGVRNKANSYFSNFGFIVKIKQV